VQNAEIAPTLLQKHKNTHNFATKIMKISKITATLLQKDKVSYKNYHNLATLLNKYLKNTPTLLHK